MVPPDNVVFYACCFITINVLFLFLVAIFLHNGFWTEYRSWMLLLYKTGKTRRQTLLLLFLSSLGLQQSTFGNCLTKFLVWFSVDFLGSTTA